MSAIKYLQFFRFIIKDDLENAEKVLQHENIDFDEFKKFIFENLLAGNIYFRLGNLRIKDIFPKDLTGDLRTAYLGQWTKNEQLVKEVARLNTLLKYNKKEAIFLKGPFFAQRFHGNIDRRFIADIDILVHEKDVNSIEEELKKDGFRLVSGSLFRKGDAYHFIHHFEYRKGDIKIELHWALSTHPSFRIDYHKIWQEKQKFTFRKKDFWILSNEYALVVQILSGFKDIELGTITLRAFLDVYCVLRAMKKDIDWHNFFGERKKEGLFVVSLNILDLALEVMDCREEFKELTQYLEENKTCIEDKDPKRKLERLDRSKAAIRNKLWAFTLYDTSLARAICWWFISLPVRLIVHKEQSFRLLKK